MSCELCGLPPRFGIAFLDGERDTQTGVCGEFVDVDSGRIGSFSGDSIEEAIGTVPKRTKRFDDEWDELCTCDVRHVSVAVHLLLFADVCGGEVADGCSCCEGASGRMCEANVGE